VKAQWLLHREALDAGKVRTNRQLRHSQGDPSATTDAALDGGGNLAARGLELILPRAWGNPQVI
jgi:hypothetical protein